MATVMDQEEKVLCPYNSAHFIIKKRLNGHLTKCRKNYPNAKMLECEFNRTHLVPEPELKFHYDICPDRRKVEQVLFEEHGASINKFPIKQVAVDTEESWDSMDNPSYNPAKYCEANEIIRHLDVASASQRKNFRVEERHRIQKLANNKPTPAPPAPKLVEPPAKEGPLPRRNLPDKPIVSISESTPASVSKIIKRVNIKQ